MSLLLMFIFTLHTHALELKGQQGKSYTLLKVKEWRVSSSCQKECLALKDYTSSFKDFERKKGNPASEFCNHVGGTDNIVSHPNLDQDSICLFSDGSYILSWDLFRKNQKVSR